jgi:putative FmdB family regulatory protein
MPEYEYLCKSCNKVFDLHLTLDDHEHGKVKCPNCGSSKVEQQYPAFFAVTEKKS